MCDMRERSCAPDPRSRKTRWHRARERARVQNDERNLAFGLERPNGSAVNDLFTFDT